ncbi:LysR family transcriptional regulator [Salinimonas sediminis]|uniref:HTH-type transcriptional regulator MetR n=1 Tax=Salinimonas sediminis TaxID=2303538 RepID=A0A346NJS9_9ALTE|nr:LysR family transcriptional regulator [Salinimonas sediminis]AXR05786.1 LysR family transcriptional regulator [Salinimonas sediminis]
MIERQHLRIIMQIERHGSLTGAADALHLTQSALSHAIKRLESQLGTELWQKNGRTLRLTQAGEAVLALAQRVLPQFDHTEMQVHQIAQGKQGVLRIGMECHPCYQWLLKVVEPFLLAYPQVDVDVRQAFKFGGLHALHGYEIDLLLTPDPLFLDALTYIPVFHYEQVLTVASHHPLAGKPMIEAGDLANEVLITYPVEPSRLDIFNQFLTPAGGSVKRHKTIETTEILLQMVSAGRGVAALPDWLVSEYADALGLCQIKLGARGIHKALHLGYRKEETPGGYFQAFIDMAESLGRTGAVKSETD